VQHKLHLLAKIHKYLLCNLSYIVVYIWIDCQHHSPFRILCIREVHKLIYISASFSEINYDYCYDMCRWLRIRFQLVNQLLYLTVSSTNFNCFETKYGEVPSNTEQQRKHVFHLNPSFRLHRQSHGSSNSSVIVRKENSQIQSHVQYQLRQELRKQTQSHDSVTIGNQRRKERLQTIRWAQEA